MALTYELRSGGAVVYRGGSFDTISALASDAVPRIQGLGGEIDVLMAERLNPGHTYCLSGGERLAIMVREG